MILRRALCAAAFAAAGLAHAQAPAPAPVPAPASAAQAAEAPPAAPAPSLGRLFFTPDERAALDEARRRPVAEVAVQEKPALPPPPEYVTLNGVVRRSDGTTTIWLNNKPVRGQRSEEGLIVAPASRATAPGNVTVVVPQSGRRVDLKVGQQLEVTSGKVQEPYRVPQAANVASESKPPSGPAPEQASPRRASRDRELLRELLRDIDGPPAGNERSDPTPAAPAPAR